MKASELKCDFDQVLDAVSGLPLQQQEDVVRIVQKRMTESKREQLANAIHEARAEYQRGEVKKGSVADLMQDLDE